MDISSQDPFSTSLSSTTNSHGSNAAGSAFESDKQMSDGLFDLDLSLFGLDSTQPSQQAGPMQVANPNSFLSAPSPHGSTSSSNPDLMLISPNPTNAGPPDQPSDATIMSPWGSLPSEPNVIRVTKHRRGSSIGSVSSNDRPHHRRASSFHYHRPSIPTMEQANDRRGSSVGQMYSNGIAGSVHPNSTFPMNPPVIRQNSVNGTSCPSPLSQNMTTWLPPHQPQPATSTHIRSPPRASLPDIHLASQANININRTRLMGHRRGYSIDASAPASAPLLSLMAVDKGHATPVPAGMAARRQHSMEALPSSVSEEVMQARKAAMRHRRGYSVGQIVVPLNAQMYNGPQQWASPLNPQQPHILYDPFQHPRTATQPPSIPSTPHNVRSYNHSRSDSFSSQASFIPSPSLSAACEMDPSVLETFVNMQLQGESSDFSDFLNADFASSGVEGQIPNQELSILNDLAAFEFPLGNSPKLGRDSQPMDIQRMDASMPFYPTVVVPSNSVAAAAETSQNSTPESSNGVPPSVKVQEDDEEDGAASPAEEDEEGEEAAEQEVVEHRCKWVDCDTLFDTVEDLVAHVSDLHIGSGKPTYKCMWENCTRNQRPFTKRHKIHNHLRIHTGERPFECPVPDCGKKFSRQDGLNTHVKTHSNIKPYICTYYGCGKAYYHSRSLRKHEKSHLAPTLSIPLMHNGYGMPVMMVNKGFVHQPYAAASMGMGMAGTPGVMIPQAVSSAPVHWTQARDGYMG